MVDIASFYSLSGFGFVGIVTFLLLKIAVNLLLISFTSMQFDVMKAQSLAFCP